MASWLRTLLRGQPSEDQLLNEGLALAMDWGDNWLSPINARLGKVYPHLGATRLDELNARCQGAMRLAYEAVHASLHAGAPGLTLEGLATLVRAPYPWVNDENLARLLRQGVYYAAKVGSHTSSSVARGHQATDGSTAN